jgi:hypothetical protein
MSGPLWSIATVVGPLLLLALIIWAWARNRARHNQGEADAGARRLEKQINAEDQRRGT